MNVYEPHGSDAPLETVGAWLLGVLWVLPLLYAFWTAFHPAEFSTRISLSAPLTLANFIAAWHAAPFARYFLNTRAAGDDGAGGAAGADHARRLRVRALRVPRPQRAVRAGAGAAHGHARRADRRELPHDDRARPEGHDHGHRPAVHGERVRHLPAAPDLQGRAARTGRGRAGRGLHAAAGAVEGLRAARAADLSRVRAGQRQLPLEQFPVAAHHHQFGRSRGR